MPALSSFKELENEVPFPFDELHLHLKQAVIEKLIFEELLTLSLCNIASYNVCWSKTFRVPYSVHAVTVKPKHTHVLLKDEDEEEINWNIVSQPPARISAKFLFIHDELSSNKIQKIIRQLKKNRTDAQNITLLGPVTCKPQELICLFELVKSRTLEANHFIKEEFLKKPFFQNLDSLKLKRCALTDNHLLRVQSPNLEFISKDVTDDAINRFIKRWLYDQRRIDSVSIGWYSTNGPRVYDVIFADIDVNPIWTLVYHRDSLIGSIDFNYFGHLMPMSMYSIWRPSDISDNRIIRCTHKEIVIYRGGEASELHRTMSPRYRNLIPE